MGRCTEERIFSEMVNQDFIVRMPPISEYKITITIKSIEKATPRIVEPEEVKQK